MKKDRNTFFSESNMYQANNPMAMMQQPPMMQQSPMMMQNPAPYQVSTASNAFYSGPNQNMVNSMTPGNMIGQMPANTGIPMENYQTNNTSISNLESRLAKMERQIRRLETRLNKLESNYSTSNLGNVEEIDTNYSSSMYMI